MGEDHGPDRQEEFLRIKSLPEDEYPAKLLFVYDKESVYRKYECPRVFLDSGEKDPIYTKDPWSLGLRPTNVRYEPAVYAVTPPGITNDITCIAMTRSLGDFYAQQFGLSSQPSISVHKFPSDNEFVVSIASDGVWDCWHYDAFGSYVNAGLRSTSLVSFISQCLDETIRKAKSSFGSENFDDATLIILKGSW